MSVSYKCLKVFLCSASGTAAEETAVTEAIQQINRGTREHLGIEFELFSWRDLTPRTQKGAKGRKQEEINEYVKECDIFILLLWKRHGSYEPGQTRTNLEREVDEALSRLEPTQNISMLSYFRNITVSSATTEQETGVLKLRKRLVAAGVFHKSYEDPAEFKERILPDLYETLLKSEFDTPKQRAMRRFWKFGISEKKPRSKLLISYAGMDRAYMQLPQNDNDLWIRRLVPNIVYEDHRALQKINKVLRLIRMDDFHTCTLANLPDDWRYMNRCWICIPRNPKAIEQLKHHANMAQFKFGRSRDNKHAAIMWKNKKASRAIRVESPLELYLQFQRKGDILQSEWNRNLRDVVARDYAIVARFPVRDKTVQVLERQLMEYFIGGIRGLGTWGAGWFIDRRWSVFEECRNFEPFQRLVEVTYLNGRIDIVRDVSKETQSYFNKQVDPKFIANQIKKYQS